MPAPLGPRNRRVVTAAGLHRARERSTTGSTLIEGPHLLEEALAAGVIPETVFALEEDRETARLASERGLQLFVVSPPAMARLAGTKAPRGPLAVVSIPTPRPGATDRSLLVAWGVSDPGNMGTLTRTAAAFAWDLGHTAGSADPWSPKVLRAGAGAHFRTGVGPVASLESLRAGGYRIVASAVSDGIPVDRADPGRCALLVGEEGAGLPADVTASADLIVTIPMPGGTESLNVAAAAAILVYQLSKAGGHDRP